jgi:hypothetical protein
MSLAEFLCWDDGTDRALRAHPRAAGRYGFAKHGARAHRPDLTPEADAR